MVGVDWKGKYELAQSMNAAKDREIEMLKASNKPFEGGRWKSNRAFIAWMAVAVLLGMFAMYLLTRSASASETTEMPINMVYAFCHPSTNTVMLDGPLFAEYANTGVRCLRRL